MDWIFDELEQKAAGDVYSARSWLLVTKCIFPQNFRVLFEAYKLEKSEENVEQCAALITEIFRDFPNEYLLNKELEAMVLNQGNEKEDQLLSSIFNSIQLEMQQSILIFTAGRQTDISSRCKLTLLAIQKNTKDALRYGMPLTEKLVNDEKMEGPGGPLNKHRKLLVCDVLPVVCGSSVEGLSPKQFYKWLQKAMEFYVAYHTSPLKTVNEAIGKLDLTWSDLEALRSQIGMQCDWEPFRETNPSLVDRMKHIKEMHRLSRTDVSGNINKRQIFYTSLLLLLESSIKFMELLDSSFFSGSLSVPVNMYVVILQPVNENLANSSSASLSSLKDTLQDYFQVARTSWHILHSNESFSKDLNHLMKRWKMERWVWFQLFLAVNYLLEKDYGNAIVKLNRLMEQNWSGSYQCVDLRCLCLLLSAYYARDQSALACKCIINCLRKMEMYGVARNIPSNKIESITFSEIVDGKSLVLLPLNVSQLLPIWIHIFVTRLFKKINQSSCKDETLGHLLVLSQHSWPMWRSVCGSIFDIISKRPKFSYPIFFDYVVISDILEEIALIWNSNESSAITLYHGAFAHQQRVTRGVNKGTAEEFNAAITAQMNKGEDELEDVLVSFLLKQEDSLLECLCTDDVEG